MVLPDVDILVAAFRRDHPHHARCRAWLDGTVNGARRFGMAPLALSGFVRIVTHPKVFHHPTAPEDALRFCEAILGSPNCTPVQPGVAHWPIFARLCRETGARGNAVPDAFLAAIAIEQACEFVTLDRGFARFSALRRSEP